ncbi:outer membrane protein, partial [Helicobacter felis]|uniref:outer membrane protein n=2 Tax=Helicobacter felis TaxID=214 RepID=UPI001F368CBE
QTTNHKRSVCALALSTTLTLFSLTPLSAENNGVFIGAGFQYSNFQNASKALGEIGAISARSRTNSENLFGADIQVGYKQFFGGGKIFGMRYYGFFSGQGGGTSFTTRLYDEDYGVHTVKINQSFANLFYGVGADFLYNFYENSDRTYGAFVGVMIGGSSWLMGEAKYNGQCYYTDNNGNCQTLNEVYKQSVADWNTVDGLKATFSPTYVQFLFNIGFRMNFTKHQGFEFGVRIPTIDDPYIKVTATKDKGSVKKGNYVATTLRRTVGVFANYVINF